MEKAFVLATAANLMLNLCYTIVALLIGMYALKWMDKNVFKRIDFEVEIQKGNIAAAIFASTILLFVALIVSFGLKG